ncbi:vacuolar protein sorting-associated protein 52 homolog isoform X3 [Artemia franciscana]|uniref:Vacuolar protein sorting-associated protein 52 homolog n=2 Tax=Artemia franciscana TaxID=6661 RepID=A0AA88IBR7_ARTSF|nr:hypothetical protein QYM36_006076 [Artemia franciscana]
MESKILNETDADAIVEVLQSGIDIREFSTRTGVALEKAESESIQEYLHECENIIKLHEQISECDNVLENLETLLTSFQEKLGSISSEIMNIQRQSINISVKLGNRQAVKGELTQFLDELLVSKSLVNYICEAPATKPEFIESLKILDSKIAFAKEQKFRESTAFKDVQDVLNMLKTKALTKIREYLLQKIQQFKKPMTNYQIPQNELLKQKFFYQFIMCHQRELAAEVRSEYFDTISKMYYSYYSTYLRRLMRLQFGEAVTKEDLLGIEENVNRGFFSKPSLKQKSTVFTVGSRGDVLTSDLEAPIILPHAAQKAEIHYTFEALFRSMQFCLLDNSCREYLFITEFFCIQGPTAQEYFMEAMGKTLQAYKKLLEDYIPNAFDSIALFLCIHLVYRYKMLCHKRAVPSLDKYWDSLHQLLWLRFEHVMQLNIQSVRDFPTPKHATVEVRPHYVVRRFAEFSAALESIDSSFPQEMLQTLLGTLSAEIQNLMLRLASIFSQRRDQLIFLINNYDMILQIRLERNRNDVTKESGPFSNLLLSRTEEFVEDSLILHFGNIINFLKNAEIWIRDGKSDLISQNEGLGLSICRAFVDTWKKAVEILRREILGLFPNLKTGSTILQAALSELIQYYDRLLKALSHPGFKHIPTKVGLPNIHQFMADVKKFKPIF